MEGWEAARLDFCFLLVSIFIYFLSLSLSVLSQLKVFFFYSIHLFFTMGQTLVYQARPFSLAYWKLELGTSSEQEKWV